MNTKILNLFVVGAAKSGTSSLWEYLKQHPRVFMPLESIYKEPAYFSDLKAGYPEKIYFGLFQAAVKHYQYMGEASTSYLTDPVSASRLFKYNPSAKIIIMLRNPALRAYSQYNWMVQDGYERAGNFEKALALEPTRKNTRIPNLREIEYYYNYLYFESGCYYKQVKRYLDLFGSKNVYVSCFEDFLKDQKFELKKLCDFLEINYVNTGLLHKNSSKYVISPRLQVMLRQLTMSLVRRGLIDKSSKLKRDMLLQIGKVGFLKPKKLSTDTYSKLMTNYSSDISLLQEMTNIDFISKWVDI